VAFWAINFFQAFAPSAGIVVPPKRQMPYIVSAP
jgi:hypothetical protein